MSIVTECSLLDILKVDNVPNDYELVKSSISEFKDTPTMASDGELHIFESTRGVIIRYTNTKNWIKYVRYMVDKYFNDGKIIIVDCGYQFTRLFQNDNRVVVIEYEDMIKDKSENHSVFDLDEHVAVTFWSNVGLVDGYSEQLQRMMVNKLVLGVVVVGVFAIREE